ncbi:MAG: hypothetical protein A4E56_02818 [Pelotomaculum sp. PtaU1.Bin065]|nr:MAG: hypothetical protein A4E56_02818 [Pelotomaculum sp. PtaU1.Bin065]
MKYRDGFVTNSSSTNFLIISKEELTVDYLYEKLGFTKGSPIESVGRQFCSEIIHATSGGVRWFEIDEINYQAVLEVFGEESALKYKELNQKGYKTYMGYTSSDEDYLTVFFTMDSFVINEKDFYLNGQNCVW